MPKQDVDSRYKDEIRHGGKRGELIELFGLTCSSCGVKGESFDIVAHHLTGNSSEHHLQVLLCRRCHALLHLTGKDKKDVRKAEILSAMKASTNLDDAARLVGLSRSVFRQRRKRYGLMNKPCANCGKDFIPSNELKKYCTDECAIQGKRQKYDDRKPIIAEQKVDNDRRYRERHKEELAEKKRKYYLEHIEEIKARTREWYKKRKESKENQNPEEGAVLPTA